MIQTAPLPESSFIWYGDNPNRAQHRIESDALFHRLVQAQSKSITDEALRFISAMRKRDWHL